MQQEELFKRELPRRVILIDLNSVAMTMYYAGYNSKNKLGVWKDPQTNEIILEPYDTRGLMFIDTFMISGVLKSIASWSNGGQYPVYCLADSKIISRKAYMKRVVQSDDEYKGDRDRTRNEFFQLLEVLENILKVSKVPVIRKENYEADDLIFAVSEAIKSKYKNVRIDVITKDADMIPMVDEQVSIYCKSKKETYYEKGSPRKPGYFQVTPKSYQRFCESLSKNKGLSIPYNTLLLAKILRGDSDNVPILSKDWKPKVYNTFLSLVGHLIDLPYEPLEFEIVTIEDGTPVNIDTYDGDRSLLKRRFKTPESALNIKGLIQWYEDEINKEIGHENYLIKTSKERTGRKSSKKIKDLVDLKADEFLDRYLGMILNGAFTSEMGMEKHELRAPYRPVIEEFVYMDYDIMKSSAKQLMINLKDF